MALQVARKIAPCDRALIHVCLAYLFLHSREVLSSFKCYFKRKYLNLIDSNCDVDESCPWFFIGTVLAAGIPRELVPVTRCNFSCNLQRYSTLGKCKIGKYTFPSQFANIYS